MRLVINVDDIVTGDNVISTMADVEGPNNVVAEDACGLSSASLISSELDVEPSPDVSLSSIMSDVFCWCSCPLSSSSSSSLLGVVVQFYIHSSQCLLH